MFEQIRGYKTIGLDGLIVQQLNLDVVLSHLARSTRRLATGCA